VFVRVVSQGEDLRLFETTVSHNDERWNHYADAWQVVDTTSGKVIAERVLAHPHISEQLFTRSLSGIRIPSPLYELIVRVKCNIHGFGGRKIRIDMTADEGEGFKIICK